MFRTTKELKKRMGQHELIPKRLREMKNYYEGETMYIVNCGPSLNTLDETLLREKLSDKLVLANKQAYNKVGSIADFHTLNLINLQSYNYESDNTMVIWELFEDWHANWIFENNLRHDLMLPVVGNHIPNPQRMEESQAGKLSFEDWTLDKTIYRQFGPGQMYEVVMHLPIYFGCKEVVVLAWDINNLDKYKGDDPNEEIFDDHFYSTDDNVHGDIQLSKCGATYRELQLVIESTKYIHEWYKSKDIKLKLISDRSAIHESWERIKLEDIE
tara:strand:+ start:3900 stop:4712 length:813 start_codon:yes stop_codon:yes gene_type:complete